MNTLDRLFKNKDIFTVARCEANDWFELGFYKHHYKHEDINKSCNAFLFYIDGEVIGFGSILNRPYKNCRESVGFHRLCVLPRFRRFGFASFMFNFIAGIFKNSGYKVYNKCESPIGEYLNAHPESWQPTVFNGVLRKANSSEGIKYRNRLESISYCHEYIGEPITGYEELLLPINEMRNKEMLYKQMEINNMGTIINKIKTRISKAVIVENKQDTTKREIAKNDIKTKSITYRTMGDAMDAARNLPPKKQLFKELWYEEEICILYSEQGNGKTICAMQIANAISPNEKVCYFDYELSDRQVASRYSENGVEYEFNDNFMRPTRSQITFKDDQVGNFLKYIQIQIHQYGVKKFIIDNITALSHQLESGSKMIKLMEKLVDLKEKYGISILILAHTKKRNKTNKIEDNDLAGSKKILAMCDSAFAIGTAINDRTSFYIKQIKARECRLKYGEDNVIRCHIEKINSFIQFVEDGFANEEDLLDKNKGNNKAEIIEMMLAMREGGKSNRAIAKELNISEATVRNYIRAVFANQIAS